MDLNTKLRYEELFKICLESAGPYQTKVNLDITNLAKKNIFTVGDFLNTDVDKMTTNKYKRKIYRIVKDILNNKYNGIKMVRDVVLERTLTKEDFQETIWRLLYEELGIIVSTKTADNLLAREFGESVKVIDVLKIISIIEYDLPSAKSLTDFYIAYYEKENVNSSYIVENNTAQNNCVENDIVKEKTTVESLKDELIRLLNQRNALDMKISELLNQVNALEGGKTNGRK